MHIHIIITILINLVKNEYYYNQFNYYHLVFYKTERK